MVKTKRDTYNCGVELSMDILGGKWKMMILWCLRIRSYRFGQIKRYLNGISEKVLSGELKELNQMGLVNKKVYYQVPLKVEYSLTSNGKTLIPILYSIFEWGTNYAKVIDVDLKTNQKTIDKILDEKHRILNKINNDKKVSSN